PAISVRRLHNIHAAGRCDAPAMTPDEITGCCTCPKPGTSGFWNEVNPLENCERRPAQRVEHCPSRCTGCLPGVACRPRLASLGRGTTARAMVFETSRTDGVSYR